MPARETKVGWIDGSSSRQPIEPQKLVGMSAGLCLFAFSSVEWLAKTLDCSIDEARQLKINAQFDFENAMVAARRAKGMMP